MTDAPDGHDVAARRSSELAQGGFLSFALTLSSSPAPPHAVLYFLLQQN